LIKDDGLDACRCETRIDRADRGEIYNLMAAPRQTLGAFDRDFGLPAVDMGMIGDNDDLQKLWVLCRRSTLKI
jgi:hypothetical protein